MVTLALSLSPPPYPFKSIHIHTQPPPTPCWGSKWSKITHSATQSLLHLALGTDCFISWLFPPFLFSAPSFSSLVPSSVLYFFFFFHTIVTLLKQEQGTLNCLTFLIVWSVSTWFGPTHQECVFLFWTPLLGRNRTCYVHHKLSHWHRPVLVVHFCSNDAKKQNKKKADTALTRQKGFL